MFDFTPNIYRPWNNFNKLSLLYNSCFKCSICVDKYQNEYKTYTKYTKKAIKRRIENIQKHQKCILTFYEEMILGF